MCTISVVCTISDIGEEIESVHSNCLSDADPGRKTGGEGGGFEVGREGRGEEKSLYQAIC